MLLEKVKNQYLIKGINKFYIPDFLIKNIFDKKILLEIKGYEEENKKQAKYSALQLYCLNNNFSFQILERHDIEKLSKSKFQKTLPVLRNLYKKGEF